MTAADEQAGGNSGRSVSEALGLAASILTILACITQLVLDLAGLRRRQGKEDSKQKLHYILSIKTEE
jgi:hypothetical protein